jgi:glycosyltransferase involved in cell wall biosynthesis
VVTGIRYLAHWPGSGLGDAAAAYLSGLRAQPVPVSWVPLDWGTGTWGPPRHQLAPWPGPSPRPYQHSDICNIGLGYDVTLVHSLMLWHDSWQPPGRHVAYATYEADRLPDRSVATLNKYDTVLVPSRQNLEVFRDSGVVVPVRLVPHIARPPRPGPAAGAPDRPGETFVFYSIATWTCRKAVPDVIRAFLDAFTAADDVALVLKTTEEDHVALRRLQEGRDPEPGPYSGTSWWSLARLMAKYPDPPPVRLLTRALPRAEIDALHACGDCFVSLARGEGWGLGAFEAGAAGNPVVVPGWGGHLDYLPAGYPYCAGYRLVPTAAEELDDWWELLDDQRWAKADVAHASSLLRHVFENRGEARHWGHRLRQQIMTNYTAEQVVPQLLTALSPPAAA